MLYHAFLVVTIEVHKNKGFIRLLFVQITLLMACPILRNHIIDRLATMVARKWRGIIFFNSCSVQDRIMITLNWLQRSPYAIDLLVLTGIDVISHFGFGGCKKSWTIAQVDIAV